MDSLTSDSLIEHWRQRPRSVDGGVVEKRRARLQATIDATGDGILTELIGMLAAGQITAFEMRRLRPGVLQAPPPF